MNRLNSYPPLAGSGIDSQVARRSFSQAAHTYDVAAVLQREVNDRMLARLQWLKIAPQQIVDLGCGTGYAQAGLAAVYPQAQRYALDFSEPMLHQTRQSERDRQAPWWRFWQRGLQGVAIAADLRALPLAAHSVDMLWSCLALQWLDDPQMAFREMQRVLKPDGVLMFATFGPDTLRELRESFAAVDNTPHVNQFLDMHDLGDMLLASGFSEPVMDVEYITMTYSNVRDLLADLKSIGAHNAAKSRARGLLGRQAWQKMLLAYEAFRVDGHLPATWEIVYGHAWKAPAPAKVHREDVKPIVFHHKVI